MMALSIGDDRSLFQFEAMTTTMMTSTVTMTTITTAATSTTYAAMTTTMTSFNDGVDGDGDVAATVFAAATLVTMWIIAVAGNSLACLVIHRSRRLQSTTNYFVVSLSVADLLLAVLAAPFLLAEVLLAGAEGGNRWPFPGVVCRLVRFVQFLVPGASAFVFVAVVVDRYYTIVYPLSFAVTRGRAKRMLVAAWLAAVVVAAPCLYFFDVVVVAAAVESDSGTVSDLTPGSGTGATTGLGTGLTSTSSGLFDALGTVVSGSTGSGTASYGGSRAAIVGSSPSSTSTSDGSGGGGADGGVMTVSCPTGLDASTAGAAGLAYTAFAFVVAYAAPFAVVVVGYARIARHIWRFGVGGRPFQRTTNPVQRAKVKMIKMLILLNGVSAALMAPFFVVHLVRCSAALRSQPGAASVVDAADLTSTEEAGFAASVTAAWIYFAATVAKPVVYVTCNSNFRRGCREMLCMSAMKCYRSHAYAITTSSTLAKKNHIGIATTADFGSGGLGNVGGGGDAAAAAAADADAPWAGLTSRSYFYRASSCPTDWTFGHPPMMDDGADLYPPSLAPSPQPPPPPQPRIAARLAPATKNQPSSTRSTYV